MTNTAGLYHEPPPEEIHLYEQRADSKWYYKDTAELINQNRLIEADEMIADCDLRPGDFRKVIIENPKHIQAMKDGKPPMDKLPLRVLTGDARVHQLGADKYGERNWRREAIKSSTYEAAIMRHFLAHFSDREDKDPESGLSHLYHIRACCAVMIDAEIEGKLIDDRDRAETHG